MTDLILGNKILYDILQEKAKEQEHEPGCPAIADDESDYEHLYDAGRCCCKFKPREEVNQLIKTRKVLPTVIEKCSECPYCHTREIVKQAYSYTSTTCCLAPTTVKTFWNGIPDNCPLPNEPAGYTCK